MCLFFSCEKGEKELLKLVKKYSRTDPNLAIKYSDELIGKSVENNDTEMLFNAYLYRGVILTDKGDHKEAIEILNKWHNLLIDLGEVDEIPHYTPEDLKVKVDLFDEETYINLKLNYRLRIGNAYVLYGDDDKALEYYSSVHEEATMKKLLGKQLIARINIAKVTRNIGKCKEALQIYKETLQQSKNIETSERNKYLILMGLGGTYLTLHQPDSALYYSKKGLKLSIANEDDNVASSYFYHDIGIAHNQKGEYDKALTNLNKAKDFIESINNDERLGESYFHIGKSYYGLKEYDTSIEKLTIAIQLFNQSEKINNEDFRPQELVKTYELLSENFKIINDKEKSILYKKIGQDLSSIIDTKTRKINEKLYITRIRQKDILLMQNEASKKMYLYAIGIISLLCAIIFGTLLYYKKKAKNNKRLFEKLISDSAQKEKETNATQKEIIINGSKVTEILKRLEKIEGQEYFLESSCSLANMAKKAKTNATYLTKVLKQYKEKTFYQYLNELRINYAIERLKTDKLFRQYTVKHIALEVGYKSPESFTKHFKKETGINPSYYIKELEKRNNVSIETV
ncbi:helix-turn-helix domain-containing protein [uncultured Kordia sp.]|uniref:helix-turn-helix domain-containing protein n=1 Tax=uncultured Kordia sp. TaxID=507699 RepID=UPI00262243A3|nr:helix-turn-helix domain-containing protein [uncultured Kordia sp.]